MECYSNKAPQCSSCEKPILDKTYSAMNKTYHLACFVCSACGNGFENNAFVAHENNPYHQNCFKSKFGKKCGVCETDITGEYLEFDGVVTLLSN